MNTCKTCRHWNRTDDKSIKRLYGKHVGNCGSEKFVYDEPVPVDGLQYWDYEGYSAGFRTGEDFGCIHHSPNESNSQL